MRKLRLVATTLCLVATLALAVPAPVYAEGPQGTTNSAPAPPPPPPDLKTIIFWIIVKLF